MTNPNAQALKKRIANEDESLACYNMGLLPLVPYSTHPQLVYRWELHRVVAPYQDYKNNRWQSYIWVNAWVFALFHLSKSATALSNGWSSQQQNKPHMLQLKISYKAALDDPEKRLTLLTELALGGLAHLPRKHRRLFNAAISINMEHTHKEIDDD